MATPIEQARAKRSEKASDKREYARKLLAGNPAMTGAQLGGMVHSKFGSGLSNATLTDLRREALKGKKPRDLEGDEKLEVELIAQLQGLMKRQNYLTIIIPAEGEASIRLMREVEKTPGAHLEVFVQH